MTDSIYQLQAKEYNTASINVLPIHEDSKVQALKTFMWWQYDAQEKRDLDRLFYREGLGVGVLGGFPSGNLFFVDCERWDIFLELQNATIQYIRKENIAYDLPAVKTYRGGHLWLRAPFPVQPHSYGDWEIKAQGNYVLAPPSIHPSGTQYIFLNDCARIPVVASLPFVQLEPKFVPRISRFAHNLFRNRQEREYGSKSERDQAFILSLVRSGFDQEQIGKFLSIVQFESKYKEMLKVDLKGSEQYLAHSFKWALATPDSEQFTEARGIVSKWEKWAFTQKWTGRTGAMDRAVFLGHLYCVNSAGSLIYNASVRQLAELAQTSPMTISNANKRLADMNLIRLHRKTFGFEAYSYALNPDPHETSERDKLLHAGDSTSLNMSTCPSMSHDLASATWEHQGLGKTAHLIWLSLNSPQPTQKCIAELTGRSLKTVSRLIPRLLECGLIVKGPEGYVQRDDINWAKIAERLGTKDRQIIRSWKHQRQREAYRLRFRRDEEGERD